MRGMGFLYFILFDLICKQYKMKVNNQQRTSQIPIFLLILCFCTLTICDTSSLQFLQSRQSNIKSRRDSTHKKTKKNNAKIPSAVTLRLHNNYFYYTIQKYGKMVFGDRTTKFHFSHKIVIAIQFLFFSIFPFSFTNISNIKKKDYELIEK